MKLARPGALVMHCLPAYRGKEIDEETFEANAQTIFEEAENRLQCKRRFWAGRLRDCLSLSAIRLRAFAFVSAGRRFTP